MTVDPPGPALALVELDTGTAASFAEPPNAVGCWWAGALCEKYQPSPIAPPTHCWGGCGLGNGSIAQA